MPGKDKQIAQAKERNLNLFTSSRQYVADVWVDKESYIFKVFSPARQIAEKVINELEVKQVDQVYNKTQTEEKEAEVLLIILEKGQITINTRRQDAFFSIDVTLYGEKTDPTKTAEIIARLTSERKIDHVNQSAFIRGVLPLHVKEEIERKKAIPEEVKQEEEQKAKEKEQKTEEIADRLIKEAEERGQAAEEVRLAEATTYEKFLERLNKTFTIEALEIPLIGFLLAKTGVTIALGKICLGINFTTEKK